MRKLIFYGFFLTLLSCGGIKSEYLENGITKIPSDSTLFFKRYRLKYKVIKPERLDTNVIYHEIYYVSDSGDKFYRDGNWNTAYRFYSNGNVNSFNYRMEKRIDELNFDPDFWGTRGLAFVGKKQKHFLSFFGRVSEWGRMGFYKKEISIKGDTLFVRAINDSFTHVFLRHQLKGKNLNYTADW